LRPQDFAFGAIRWVAKETMLEGNSLPLLSLFAPGASGKA
jgi:hypothetical protein